MEFDPLWIWAAIGVFIAACAAWDYAQTIKRRAGLRALATARGLRWSEWRQDLAALPFPYFLSGQKRTCRNALEGAWDGLAVTIFDYAHEEDMGAAVFGRRSATKERTVVLIDSGLQGRQVDIAKRRPFDDLRGTAGFDDVRIGDPDFALHWRARASDERFALALIDQDLAHWIGASAPDVRFDIGGRWLAVIAPLTWPVYIDQLVALAREFRDRLPQAVKAQYAPRA